MEELRKIAVDSNSGENKRDNFSILSVPTTSMVRSRASIAGDGCPALR